MWCRHHLNQKDKIHRHKLRQHSTLAMLSRLVNPLTHQRYHLIDSDFL